MQGLRQQQRDWIELMIQLEYGKFTRDFQNRRGEILWKLAMHLLLLKTAATEPNIVEGSS